MNTVLSLLFFCSDDGSGGADDDDHEFEFTTFTCTNGEKSAKSPKVSIYIADTVITPY